MSSNASSAVSLVSSTEGHECYVYIVDQGALSIAKLLTLGKDILQWNVNYHNA